MNDMVDAVFYTDDNEHILAALWFHVEYRNLEVQAQYRDKMRGMKPDALFAARTQPARRAEFDVAGSLLRPAGHSVHALHQPDSTGVFTFVIDYAVVDKRRNSSDLHCDKCGRSFEVKTRLRDVHRRVSHSNHRPFWEENEPDDFHVFWYRARNRHEVLRNADIAGRLTNRTVQHQAGEMDTYVDIGRLDDVEPRALSPASYACAGATRPH
ncbi:hypothetical protein ACI8AG_09545 [Blastococcus sp. SYSU DS0552]